MALLERVSTLVRANLNDLIDKAEDPEKMIKQVILDMQNQLLQVKTQVAISIADLHLLEKRQNEQEEKAKEWMRKAELAVDKKQDDLARAALERHKSCLQMAESFTEQIADQRGQVETLKGALNSLEQKMAEAESKSQLLISKQRRARAATRAADAQAAMDDGSNVAAFDRMKTKVARNEAISQAKHELLGDDVEARLSKLEREDEIDKLLAEVKARRNKTA